MKRVIDIFMSGMLILVTFPILVLVSVVVRLTSTGPVLYKSVRVGRGNSRFTMYKFRTMVQDCPEVATHLLNDPDTYVTSVGGSLRRSSLDELPQLLNVLQGHMSLVGPRPALHNQADLIELRTQHGVDFLRPGITGLAQVMGRDELTITEKVELETQYLNDHSTLVDLRILVLTVRGVVGSRGVSH